MMGAIDFKQFQAVTTYDDFRRLASDPALSSHEKIGFPDAYREGKERAILDDIVAKLPALLERDKTVLDVGPGCDALALRVIDLCREHGHTLVLADSEEMLAHLPDESFVQKRPGYFPRGHSDLLRERAGAAHVIIVYSVLQYVFREYSTFSFLDACLDLLAPGGRLLLGDIPNVSKRKRFFSSLAGVRFHKEFTGTDSPPEVVFNTVESGQIDDAVIAALLLRARAAGFDAYVMAQRDDLPMANRREDLLIMKP